MSIENPQPFADQAVGSCPVQSCSIAVEEDPRYQEHFKTDHLLTNLKGHTISSGAVTMLAQAVKFVLSLVSTMILARLLTPQDFGLVAMVTTVTGFLFVFKDAGLSIATVQRERITHAQVSNLFWINMVVSVLTTLIVAASAPIIAMFYHNSQLVGITLCLSITFLISGSTIQHQALLKRQMRFKALAVVEVGSITVGVLVGVVMALLGYRYWSLVGSSLSTETTGLLLTWSISRWRPRLPGRRRAHRVAGDFIFALARGADNLLIGRFYGSAAVGLYSRATALLIRPLEQFLGPINAVFVPALSRLQSQPERYRSTFLRLYESIALTGFLFTGLFLALSHPLTLVLLGHKWQNAAAIFAGFTIAALCVPLASSSTWLFTSQGRGRDMLVSQSINACVTVFSFIVGLPYGPVGVAIAFSMSGPLIRLPVLYFMVGRRGPVKTRDLWIVFCRHLPVWIVVFLMTWLMRAFVINLAPLVQLLIAAPVGVLAGGAFICSFAPQRKVAMDILDTIRDLRKNR